MFNTKSNQLCFQQPIDTESRSEKILAQADMSSRTNIWRGGHFRPVHRLFESILKTLLQSSRRRSNACENRLPQIVALARYSICSYISNKSQFMICFGVESLATWVIWLKSLN